MLGLGSATVAAWSQRFRVCVMNWEERHSERDGFGGKSLEVESDECEVGKKRKGLHGRDSDVKMERLLPGTLLFTDGARSYTSVCKEFSI